MSADIDYELVESIHHIRDTDLLFGLTLRLMLNGGFPYQFHNYSNGAGWRRATDIEAIPWQNTEKTLASMVSQKSNASPKAGKSQQGLLAAMVAHFSADVILHGVSRGLASVLG